MSERRNAPVRHLALKWAGLAAALCACGIYAYFLMFSRFGFWDDEGYLMETVRAMLQGHPVYDQIYTLYGPFYYFFEGAMYIVTGAPVTHDFVRFGGLLLWLATAVLAAWSVLRMTRSFLLAGLTLFAVSKVLVFFSGEPGHPEEICIVSVCLLLAIACTVNDRLNTWQSIAIGFLLAALSLTKINVGLYAIFAVLLALLVTQPSNRLKAVAFRLTGLASLACTAVIMMPLLHMHWTENYFLLMVLSILASLLASRRASPQVRLEAKSWYLLAAAFIVTGLITVLPFLMHGTTVSAMLYISVLQHKNFAREWFVSAPFTANSTLWAVLSLILAMCWTLRRPAVLAVPWLDAGLQVLKGVLAVFSTVYLLTRTPDDVYGVHLLKFITPFCWLVMVAPSAEAGKHSRLFARVFLSFLGVFVALYPFPVASAQLLFAVVPLIAVMAVFWHDAFVALWLQTPELWRRGRPVLSAVALILLACVYAVALRGAHAKYSALVPLNLPGATAIHVTPGTAETYKWITDELDRHCPSFFSMPGLFSFDFWTGKNAPTMMMMNDWPGFLSASQQDVIVRDLTRNNTACVLYNPQLVSLFQRGNGLSQSPVAQYIRAHFRETAARGDYHLLMRYSR